VIAAKGCGHCYNTAIMQKNVLVLLGHTDADTYSGALAGAYVTGAEAGGHNVKRVNIGDLSFDPILHQGYKVIQELEPDLLELQEAFRWADHIVIVYPNWWNTMPAILKGLFDRFWIPGFAFNFNKETQKIEKHLKGKTARVIIVAGSHTPFQTWWKYGDYTNEIQHGILEFAGIKTKVSPFGPCEKVGQPCREKWLTQVETLGKKGV
jgi:NAD(P)H dehydrogenase (quinone)